MVARCSTGDDVCLLKRSEALGEDAALPETLLRPTPDLPSSPSYCGTKITSFLLQQVRGEITQKGWGEMRWGKPWLLWDFEKYRPDVDIW